MNNIPSGVGSKGKLRLKEGEIDDVLITVLNGLLKMVMDGIHEYLEENGKMDAADSNKVSDKAKKRGIPQLGSTRFR